MHILIIEDEHKIAALLKAALVDEGFSVDTASNGSIALKKIHNKTYELIILDLMLPIISGIDVCKEIRATGSTYIPILMLTAKNTVENKVQGFDAGADDYMVKPFSIYEVVARVKALLRRNLKDNEHELVIKDLILNPMTKVVTRNGKTIPLTMREFSLLEFFMRHPDSILSRAQILDNVWDYSYEGVSNIVETYVRYIRKKIAISPEAEQLIITVPGFGYMMKSK